jgi:hypothetical protein
MKNKMIMILAMVSLCCSAALVGCQDEVEIHREADLAPRTVQQTEVLVP